MYRSVLLMLCVIFVAASNPCVADTLCETALKKLEKLRMDSETVVLDGKSMMNDRLNNMIAEKNTILGDINGKCDSVVELSVYQAWNSLLKDDPNGMEKYTNLILDKYPSQKDALYLKSYLSFKRKDADKGFQLLEKLISVDPAFSNAYYDYCYNSMVYELYQQAVTVCTNAMKYVVKNNLGFMYLYRGYSRNKLGDNEEARKDLDTAESLGIHPAIVGWGF